MTYAPKRPWRSVWRRLPDAMGPSGELALRFHAARLGLLVVSSVDLAEFRGVVRPQYHVSISSPSSVCGLELTPRRPVDHECQAVLAEMGMRGAEEDNHEPGLARHFWRLCEAAPDEAMGCECKETEETVVEPDGHRWQRPRRTA